MKFLADECCDTENAEYKKLDDGTWFAEIPGFNGVWANRKTVEECRKVQLFEGGYTDANGKRT